MTAGNTESARLFDDAARIMDESTSSDLHGEAAPMNDRYIVFDDGRDVIHVLQSYKAAYADAVKVFQLQRRVRGVAVGALPTSAIAGSRTTTRCIPGAICGRAERGHDADY